MFIITGLASRELALLKFSQHSLAAAAAVHTHTQVGKSLLSGLLVIRPSGPISHAQSFNPSNAYPFRHT